MPFIKTGETLWQPPNVQKTGTLPIGRQMSSGKRVEGACEVTNLSTSDLSFDHYKLSMIPSTLVEVDVTFYSFPWYLCLCTLYQHIAIKKLDRRQIVSV